MRYELIRVAQLVFALATMFGAFLAGLAIGWLRWGRTPPDEPEEAIDLGAVPRIVKTDLFSPAVPPVMVRVDGQLGPAVSAEPVDAEVVAPSAWR